MSEFQANKIECKVHYTEGFLDHEIHKLDEVKHEICKFKNTDDYIRHFIECIKERVIKTLPNLQLVDIHLHIFDDTNIMHRLFKTAITMLFYLLKIKGRINMTKAIIATVTYEGKFIWQGGIDFTGMQ